MRYPEYFIEELRQRADLVRIIEPYAPLKKKGANWMGCCPFHQEKTPSFSVNPAKGFYKCFGCGKGGNAFSFVMEIEGLSFPEAIKKVAEVSGVPLPEPIDDKKFEHVKKKKEAEKKIADAVIELNQFALEFWENHLEENIGRQAREYLEKRGISEETRKNFRIGFAPDSWDALMSHLKSKGADEKLIEQSGLVSINEEKKRVYDRFRGRVMFPVLDVDGKPVAFGARILDKGEPKYLNSPETPAYIKGEHLYGLFQDKEEIRKKKYAILTEGYLDLIALYQAGVHNAVASLGTAFTPQQAKLLGRFARKIVVNYDGDSAGVKAARRAIETLLAEDFEIKVLVLPNGQDPDDFIRANGFQAYKNQHKENAFPYLQFVLENATRERNLNLPKQKREAIEDVLPVICAVRNSVEKRATFDQTMSFLRVEDAVWKRELWKTVKLSRNAEAADIRKTVSRMLQIQPTDVELQLLEFLIHDKELREIILPQLEEQDFEVLATASIFRALFTIQNNGEELTADNLTNLVSEDSQATDILPLILLAEPPREPDEAIDACLEKAESGVIALRLMSLSRRISEIASQVTLFEQQGNDELRNQLSLEQIKLEQIKREIKKEFLPNASA